MLSGFLVSLAVAVGEAVIMAVLQRFIPILRGALPPPPGAPAAGSRQAAIERNRFFFAAFFVYLIAAFLIGCVFTLLPTVRAIAADIEAEGSGALVEKDYTPLRSVKFVGQYLPDVNIPATLLSGVTVQASMLATVCCMIITGVIFWPLWRVYGALGHDDAEQKVAVHASAAALSILISAWLIFYLFSPLSLIGALVALAVIIGGLLLLGALFGRR